jgi:hypothetical protein
VTKRLHHRYNANGRWRQHSDLNLQNVRPQRLQACRPRPRRRRPRGEAARLPPPRMDPFRHFRAERVRGAGGSRQCVAESPTGFRRVLVRWPTSSISADARRADMGLHAQGPAEPRGPGLTRTATQPGSHQRNVSPGLRAAHEAATSTHKGRPVMPGDPRQRQAAPQADTGSRTVQPPSAPAPSASTHRALRATGTAVRGTPARLPALLPLYREPSPTRIRYAMTGQPSVRRVVCSGDPAESVAPRLTSGLVLLVEDPHPGFSTRFSTSPRLRSSGDRAPLS